ncbi:hypothetical protein GGS26DRAFT_513741 [Hypomontagnella submonticulosa]|nr:hypothetical protein GGS26DRAFT_513741 [Hypomontagnella submonticulosa]
MRFLIQSLITLICFGSFAASNPAPTPETISLEPVLDLLGGLGNAPPPDILWTPNPSPECAAINKGELQCCQGTLAGDLPLIQFLAALYGYKLNPNDVNGILCNDNLATCPGVKLCCQVTALNPLLSLYCQDYK